MTRMCMQREIEKKFTRLMAKHFFHHHRIFESLSMLCVLWYHQTWWWNIQKCIFLCFSKIYLSHHVHKLEMRLMSENCWMVVSKLSNYSKLNTWKMLCIKMCKYGQKLMQKFLIKLIRFAQLLKVPQKCIIDSYANL